MPSLLAQLFVTSSIATAPVLNLNAQPTILAPGDIAFTGINASLNTINGPESNKDFSFVLLKAVNAGTTVYFTDYGWRTDQPAFQTANPCPPGSNPVGTGSLTDGIVKWVAGTNLTYGTQVVIRCQNTPYATVGTATGEQKTFNSNLASPQYVTVGINGETVFAYQGSFNSPTLIAGINSKPEGWISSLQNCDLDPISSALPSVFNNNNNYAFALTPSSSATNVRLIAGINIGTDPAAARAIIANKSNWEFQGSAMSLPASASVLPVKFGSIDAIFKGGNLFVSWQSLSEKSNDRFIIEASADGRYFREIGTVQSRARQGNSDAPLDYVFELTQSQVALMSAGGLLLFCFLAQRRKRSRASIVVFALLAGCMLSCSRKPSAILPTSPTVFIRLVQVDKDGTRAYSKIITVHSEN